MNRFTKRATYAGLTLGVCYYVRSLFTKRAGIQINIRITFDKITPKAKMVRTQPSVLPIKGNKNSRGEKIYHLPDGQYYEDLNAIQTFATETAAKNAGYRKSQR